jgi:hypothetical protein
MVQMHAEKVIGNEMAAKFFCYRKPDQIIMTISSSLFSCDFQSSALNYIDT